MRHLKSLSLFAVCGLASLALGMGGGATVVAQSLRYGAQATLPIQSSIDSMQDELYLGSPAQRKDLFLRLGMKPGEAVEAAGNASTPVTTLVRLRGTHASLLFTSCDNPLAEAAVLSLMLPGKAQAWQIADTQTFICWRKKVTQERIFLPGQPGEVVLVRHANAGHGSGYVSDDMLLLGVRGHRLVTLLRTEEYRSEDEGNTGATLIRRSTLQPFPDGRVQETRATYSRPSPQAAANEPGWQHDATRLIKVERRWWRWRASAQAFAAGPFHVAGQ